MICGCYSFHLQTQTRDYVKDLMRREIKDHLFTSLINTNSNVCYQFLLSLTPDRETLTNKQTRFKKCCRCVQHWSSLICATCSVNTLPCNHTLDMLELQMGKKRRVLWFVWRAVWAFFLFSEFCVYVHWKWICRLLEMSFFS